MLLFSSIYIFFYLHEKIYVCIYKQITISPLLFYFLFSSLVYIYNNLLIQTINFNLSRRDTIMTVFLYMRKNICLQPLNFYSSIPVVCLLYIHKNELKKNESCSKKISFLRQFNSQHSTLSPFF